MVAIVTGNGLGLEKSSARVLGANGQLGSAGLGRGGDGVTVNAATGNLVITNRDEFVIGRGPDLSFNRTYNSLGVLDGDNNDNWRNGQVRRIGGLTGTANAAGSTLTRTDWDGSEKVYNWDASRARYVNKDGGGAYDTIYQDGAYWIWTNAANTLQEWNYTSNGLLIYTSDIDRSAWVRYGYVGELLSYVDADDGSRTTLTYSGSNITALVTTYTDTQTATTKTLTRTRYTYDGYNRLSTVTVDLSPEDNSIADGRTYTTTYQYIGASKLVQYITQTDGSQLQIDYDAYNRVSAVTQTVENGITRRTSFGYGSGYTNITDAQGNVTHMYFDGAGQLYRIIEPAAVPGGGQRDTYHYYDGNGNVYYSSVHEGGVFSSGVYYRYDANGNLYDSYTTLPGVGYEVVRHYYGSQNQLLTSTTYTGIDGDGHGGAEPTGGMTTRYVYDSELHLRFKISAEGQVTEYRYNAPGQLISEIQHTVQYVGVAGLSESFSWSEQDFINWTNSIGDKSSATRTDTSYDFRGNVQEVTRYAKTDSAGNGILASGFTREIYVYDQYGNLLSKQSSTGEPTVSHTGLGEWASGGLNVAAAGGALNGQPANQYTVQTTGGWSAFYNGYAVADGDTVTTSMSLKGIGTSPSASIGLYGYQTGWGSNQYSIARIISGPGTISQEGGSLWNITGLSNTEETRIEIVRTYAQGDTGGGVYVYADRPSGWRAGQGVIASSPVVVKTRDATETFAYDGMGRTIRFTDAKGVGTWTTYMDSLSRTVVTLASGLTQTSNYNKAGELVAFAESRATQTTAVADFSQWSQWGISGVAAGTVDGAAATKLTINAGQTYGAAYSHIAVAAGETITYSVSLQALGAATTQYLGIYGDGTGWNQDNTGLVSARIISGSGKVNSYYGGLWRISDLSATEATRVEFTRTFTQAEGAYAYMYVHGETASPGQGLIASAVSVNKTRYDGATPAIVSPAEMKTNIGDPAQWSSYYISRTPSGTLDYAPATKMTIDPGQTYGAAYSYIAANAGDVVTLSATIQAIGANTTQLFGIHGGSSGWGDSGMASIRIVSGPGTLQPYGNYGGLSYITGLSTTTPTRIEVTRTFTQAETAYGYVYALSATGSPGDVSLVASTSLTRSKGSLTDYRYDSLGRLRIKIDPAGAKTFYFYDRIGRRIAEIANDGATTEYKYDAADRVVATVQYANTVSAAQMASLFDPYYVNPTAVEFSSIRPGASGNDRWNWNVYDKAGHLIETIDAYGGTTEFAYDAAGRIKYSFKRYYQLSSAQVDGFKINPPTSRIVPADYAGMDRATRYFYDSDGRLIGTMDSEYYLTEHKYDKAGRQIETIKYSNIPGNLGNWLNDAFATIKASVALHANDSRTYTIYDGRGLVAATIDGEGNVTRFGYDARGNVIQEVRGQVVAANTSYTLATLPAASGQLQTTNFVRDALGQVTSQTRLISSGNATSTFTYNSVGNLSSAIDARGYQSYKYYDARGRLVREEVPTDLAGGWAITRYEYDSRGNLVKVIDPRGNASYNYYDDRNRLVLAVDAEGYATEKSYNIFGEVLWVRRYYTKPSGTGSVLTRPTLAGHAKDATTYFFYENRGLVTGTTDAEGKSENFYYNSFGEKYYSVNKLGGGESFYYTRRGQLYYSVTNEQVVRNDGSTQLPHRYKNLYVYDARGNVVQLVEGYALTERRDTFYFYDRNNRLVQKNLPAIHVFDPPSGADILTTPIEYYKYDARGNLIETKDPAGGRTLQYYDESNRKIAEINAAGTHKTWTYDANGNVTVERVYGGFTSLPATAGGTPPSPSGTPRETYFSYDRNNRLIEKRVYGVLVGRLQGTTFDRTTVDLVTSFKYDSSGNVVRETDARGNKIFHYYDKNGRETGKVDQEGYLTTWERDSEGNVLTERRYANIPATGLDETSALSGIVYWTTASAADRITTFEYDKMGRRLTEVRHNVQMGTVSGNSVSQATQNVTIAYTYNAFGEVLSKTEGNGDRTDYTYDGYGRMTSRSDPGFTNQNGTAVRPITDLFYDGLNNLVYERPSDAVSGGDARSTRYVYGAGGKLKSVIDTAGDAHNYQYNIKGEVRRDQVATQRSSGSTIYYEKFTDYDAVGRITTQVAATYEASAGWVYQPTQSTAYNAYGDVASKGINGAATELFYYDKAGRMVMTNSGDGVWKFFAHDENGNATLTLTNTGTVDLAAHSWDQPYAMGYLMGWAGAINIASFNQYYTTASVATYDKRGMITDNYEPGRTVAITGNEAATTTQNLHVKRWYNAFGEATQEKSARGYYTNYTYNTMGRLLQKQSAETNVTLENGQIVRQRPTENYVYDLSGRQIASQNANGFWTTRILLAGTGYGDNEALVTVEYRPDGSSMSFGYDVHGNLRKITDGLGRITLQDFDNADRLVKITRASGLIEQYAYDALGQRIRKWNNVFQSPIYGTPVWVESGYWGGYNQYEPEWIDTSHWETPIIGYSPTVETTDYDGAGRVTSTKNFAGDVTTIAYAWNGGLATNGLGTFGGWLKTTYRPDGYYSQEYSDVYSRMTWRRDLGGREYNYTYNEAGQLAQQTSTAGQNITYSYYNTGRMATMVDNAGVAYGYSTSNVDATYTYDADGNRTYERLAGTYYVYDPYGYGGGSYSVVHQEGRGTYDELGRLTNFVDGGASGNGPVNIVNEYDAASNVRRTATTYRPFNGTNGTLGAADIVQDYWYKYDALDRMVTVKGVFTGARGSGTITRGTGDGRDITYNLAGERATVARNHISYGGYGYNTTYEVREHYEYNAASMLTAMRISQNGGGPLLRSTTSYDLLGRVTAYSEYKADGSGGVQFNRYGISYDNRNAMIGETSVTDRVESDGSRYVSYSTVSNYYGAGGVLYSSSSNNYRYKNGSTYQNSDDTSNTYTYAWWDGAVQATLSYDSNTGSGSNPIYVTNYYYDYNGHLTSAQINDGKPRTVTYVNDASGQVLSRTTSSSQTANPKQLYYYFDGKQIGANGNNGNDDPDFETSLNERMNAGPSNPGIFRNGATTATAFADFDQAFDAVNPGNMGGVGSGYMVRSGDTLQSIAQNVLGDSSLWYLIADANGIQSDRGLVAGMSLTIPTGPSTNVHNKADTFRPYDAQRAMGDTQPTTPAPPKKPKCGIFGQIFLAIIAAAVTALTAGTIGPVAAAMLGSVVSQGVGVATGIQEKFSFKAVAMAGLGAAVGAGLGALAKAGGALGKIGTFLNGSGFINSVARGVVSNVITQGIGVATGLQKKFDWAGVAVAGASAAVSWAGKELGVKSMGATKDANGVRVEGDLSFGNIAANGLQGIARAIVGAATRSLVNGSDFGDNLVSALPDAIGSTIGEALGSWGERQLHEAAEHRRSSRVGSVAEASRRVYEGEDQRSLTARQRRLLDRPSSKLTAADPLVKGKDGDLDIVLMNELDKNAHRNAALDFDIDGAFTIFSHGPGVGFKTTVATDAEGKYTSWGEYTSEEIVGMYNRSGSKENIIMLGCFSADRPGEAGAGTQYVQRIASGTGKPVLAADALVQTYPMDDKGFIMMTSRDGRFRAYGGSVDLKRDFGISLEKGQFVRGFGYNPTTKETVVVKGYWSGGKIEQKVEPWRMPRK